MQKNWCYKQLVSSNFIFFFLTGNNLYVAKYYQSVIIMIDTRFSDKEGIWMEVSKHFNVSSSEMQCKNCFQFYKNEIWTYRLLVVKVLLHSITFLFFNTICKRCNSRPSKSSRFWFFQYLFPLFFFIDIKKMKYCIWQKKKTKFRKVL